METNRVLSEQTSENIYHCIKCGLCLAHCPAYKEILLEEASPRGKVQISKFIAEGDLSLSEEVKETLFSTCLLCGSCVVNCPSGVHGAHLISGLRWRAVQKYGVDWRKKVLFQILSSGWMMSGSAWFARWARKGFGDFKFQAGALPLEKIPRMNDKPFSTTVSEVVESPGEAKARVLYFHGCATNYLYGGIGKAVVDVLPKMGVEVRIPKDQICCGLPIFLSGDRASSLNCIRKTLEIFNGKEADAIIVDCATCGAALKNEYPYLLQELRDLGEKVSEKEIAAAKDMAAKVKDVTVFIDEHKEWLPPLRKRESNLRVAYHDPCHLVKGQKVSAQPRNLLSSIPGVEYVEMASADACCGGGGAFQVEHAETSRKITKRKIDSINAVKVDAVATCCPGCNLTISAHLNGERPMEVLHPVQLLQRSLA
ncbi:MAG: (Fe-S)-binding protein [Deltaproteobacteria bacterium]|nr:(Fe-S)-binding protein [Deltaproteobacteria bacterium]